ncbi:hypothetical protein BKA65DRAFT_600965 [Rhexocercosporidium sp. MPI-PUGE-AT-0058]|nr:hypothetical protein BKA65DRAFT_600965 [Rhexocercosporidium sp. MPI-PUGE-AT-0058]
MSRGFFQSSNCTDAKVTKSMERSEKLQVPTIRTEKTPDAVIHDKSDSRASYSGLDWYMTLKMSLYQQPFNLRAGTAYSRMWNATWSIALEELVLAKPGSSCIEFSTQLAFLWGEIFDQLAIEINNSGVNNKPPGDVICAITILYRFLNRHKREPRTSNSPGTTNTERIMAEFENYVHSRTKCILAYFQEFRMDYGAHFCINVGEEQNYQPWSDLIEIQSQPKLSVAITIEEGSALLLACLPDEILNARSFTQVLDSKLSSVEEYFVDLGLENLTQSSDVFDRHAELECSPFWPLLEQFSDLHIEAGEFSGHFSSLVYHPERPMIPVNLEFEVADLLGNDLPSMIGCFEDVAMRYTDDEGPEMTS